jgi:hypothetical protein
MCGKGESPFKLGDYNCPCHNCAKRHENCHDHCKAFDDYRKSLGEVRKNEARYTIYGPLAGDKYK